MKVYAGFITGQSIGKNRDGENDVRLLQVEITEPDDVQEVQQVTWSGEDNAPSNGDMVVIIEISETYKIAIGVNDTIIPSVATGERKIYSQDGGAVKAYAYFKNNGNIQLNGSGDFAVRFTALETAYDELQSKWNTFAAAYVPGGPAVQGLPPTAGASTGDISLSKVDTVELPS